MRYCGKIGFENGTLVDGVYQEQIVEKRYYGDVYRSSRRLNFASDGANPNVTMSIQISIIADAYAKENYLNIRYATYQGTEWMVTDADPQYPRLVLTLGGRYNGDKSNASACT